MASWEVGGVLCNRSTDQEGEVHEYIFESNGLLGKECTIMRCI